MSLSKQKKFFESEAWQLFFKTLGRAFLICAIFSVTENESEEEVAETLVSKKLIYGKARFVIRKYFSKYKKNSFLPGRYEFTQSQGMDDIMGILCGDHVSEEIIQ